LWRDLGYAVGALLAGLTADALGLPSAMWIVAALTFGSGLLVAVRMTETLRKTSAPPACVEPGELVALGRGERVVVVDVRSPEEFAAGHVDGALSIPLDALAARTAELPDGSVIVTVCGKGGGRSDRAAELLRSLGFLNARPLCGGTIAWLAHAGRAA
jgi:rhodanese-related sulfurtransferase